MQLNILSSLNEEKLTPYLKENSDWIKYLNRNPKNYALFKNEIKTKYKLRKTDKINNAIENIDLISNVLNILK